MNNREVIKHYINSIIDENVTEDNSVFSELCRLIVKSNVDLLESKLYSMYKHKYGDEAEKHYVLDETMKTHIVEEYTRMKMKNYVLLLLSNNNTKCSKKHYCSVHLKKRAEFIEDILYKNSKLVSKDWINRYLKYSDEDISKLIEQLENNTIMYII